MSASVPVRVSSDRERDDSTRARSRAQDTHEINARLLGGPAMFVRDHHGDETLERLLSSAGLSRLDLTDTRRFVASAQYERFLAGVRSLVPDDSALRDACMHNLREAYGPVRYVMWATRPGVVLKLAARTLGIVMPRAECQVVHEGERELTLRYRSQHGTESRLMCLSRQAACIALPTLFGLPKAQLHERGCIAHGDEACVYELSFLARARFLPVLLAGLFGFLLLELLTVLGGAEVSTLVFLPLVMMLAAYGYEVRRVLAGNLRVAGEVQTALEGMARREAEARAEILAFHQRQREWATLVEAQVEERTSMLSDVLARIERLREARTNHLLGFSHDLRNPLTILRVSADALDAYRHALPDDEMVVDDVRYAVGRMEAMLSEMAGALSRETGLERRGTERMAVRALHDSLQRRMAALLFGRDACVKTVLKRPPEAIEADPVIVDRIMDNLLTNAAKYTERGTVTLEFDGAPGYLIIRVIDTGRGIPGDSIEQIFRPRGSDPDGRARYSLGLGLSVVLRLLAQVGGKLEVSSEVGRGSTFAVHLPQAMQLTPSIRARTNDGMTEEDLFDMIVRIRHSSEHEPGREHDPKD